MAKRKWSPKQWILARYTSIRSEQIGLKHWVIIKTSRRGRRSKISKGVTAVKAWAKAYECLKDSWN